ncbi:MAG: hypothetical protein J1E62_07155 [Lachnospiraceae bacterium]|nr:hypothetical protein [Lachnospiraceae bacterium]
MKIKGGLNYVIFDLENGYSIKAEGEMLTGRKFIAYKNTMRLWEEPHNKERVSDEQIESIINEVNEMTNENTVHIIFE